MREELRFSGIPDLKSGPIQGRMVGFEIKKVLRCDAGNLAKRFVGRKCLMGRDQDVWKHEKLRKLVIKQHLSAKILEENPLFFPVDVQPDTADMPRLERG